MKTIRIALGQTNPSVGDLKGNTGKIIEYIKKAQRYGTDIIVFPELAITGYPADDLFLNKTFIEDNMACLDKIAHYTKGICTVVGFADSRNTANSKGIYNAAAVIANRSIADIYHKIKLNRHGAFDEPGYFVRGKRHAVYNMDGALISVIIGNDAPRKANLIIQIDASPYTMSRRKNLEITLRKRALKNDACLAYVNMVGGQDEWVLCGGSVIIDKNGRAVAKSPLFEENMLIADITFDDNRLKWDKDVKTIPVQIGNKKKKALQRIPIKQPESDAIGEVYHALVLATKDYARKNGFQKTVLGISGGIDSALVAAIAQDALGKNNVIGISMPTRYTSEESKKDIARLVRNLGITLIEVPIDALFETYLKTFKKLFKGKVMQLTQENVQPRIRANILMAFSNNYGWLVLATGNKSEVGSGYSTLYGDTAGGFAVIKDISKGLVYKLSHWINKRAGNEVIPESILTKAPSAELKHDQKDTDTLPPYELLDPILTAYVEERKSLDEIVDAGHDKRLVRTVINMVDKNEYKRRQSPIGPQVTKQAFGKGWSLPITNKYR